MKYTNKVLTSECCILNLRLISAVISDGLLLVIVPANFPSGIIPSTRGPNHDHFGALVTSTAIFWNRQVYYGSCTKLTVVDESSCLSLRSKGLSSVSLIFILRTSSALFALRSNEIIARLIRKALQQNSSQIYPSWTPSHLFSINCHGSSINPLAKDVPLRPLRLSWENFYFDLIPHFKYLRLISLGYI